MRPRSYGISLYVKTLSLVLALAFLVAPLGASARPLRSRQQQQTEKRPLPPKQFIPSRDYDTLNITLNLRFDWALSSTRAT
jgi:hypothetical protein